MKRTNKFIVAVLVVLSLVAIVWADTVTKGALTRSNPATSGYTVTSLQWTSDNAGDFLATIDKVYGEIRRVTFVPSSGATSPTDAYDVTLADVDSYDILQGAGANLARDAVSATCPMVGSQGTSIPLAVYSPFTLTVANAGTTRTGTIRIVTKP